MYISQEENNKQLCNKLVTAETKRSLSKAKRRTKKETKKGPMPHTEWCQHSPVQNNLSQSLS